MLEVDERWVQNLEIGHFADVSLSRLGRAILLYSILLLYDLLYTGQNIDDGLRYSPTFFFKESLIASSLSSLW